jgi:glycerol-3-phosphate dehydrogenase
LIPTIDKNILVGPDAIEIPDREDYTTKSKHRKIFGKHKHTIAALSERDIITYFSGTRAATYEEDFVVQKGKWTKNIIHAAGIQSPGVTAAPRHRRRHRFVGIPNAQSAEERTLHPKRKGIVKTRFLDDEERDALIKKNPAYGHIICRCEEISEGEIIDAIHSPIPAHHHRWHQAPGPSGNGTLPRRLLPAEHRRFARQRRKTRYSRTLRKKAKAIFSLARTKEGK